MERPLCRLCRHRHLGNEPHVFAQDEPVQSAQIERSVDELAQQAQELGLWDEATVIPPKQRQGRDMERYRAYQRDYHRRYRAKLKGQPKA